MFAVTETEAAAIRTAFEQRGELSAVVELRRLFPGIEANQARECVRIISSWRPLLKQKSVRSSKTRICRLRSSPGLATHR